MQHWVVPTTLPELMAEFCRRLDALAQASASPCPIALTGGQSAAQFYDAWAAHGVDPKLRFYWSDERLVALDDPDSNYKLASDHLLLPAHVLPTAQYPVATNLEPAACAANYAAVIRREVPSDSSGTPHFPLIILGLGADGHTGSLFPGRDPYADTDHLVRAVEGTAMHPHPRVTFTPRLLNAASRVWVVVTGAQKAWAVGQLAERKASVKQVPALVVDPDRTELTVFADRASSGGAVVGAGDRQTKA